eukprot:TRINITY_DN33732_c0_g1_i1.p1 TRINITY_DN33732_c0_g1~~TRINITY_DN33732_c0_g1_i1.p1  ORF type:complete len:268 (-),score=60.70 TRINITY_DN33732_c0_g1_i1:205-1008(-)
MAWSWVGELIGYCECDPQPKKCLFPRTSGELRREPHALKTLRVPGHEVELAVSPLVGMRGFAGYHTSVIVDGEEFYFCPAGIKTSRGLTSHAPGADTRRTPIGISASGGLELLSVLNQHFEPGTYDLLTKNCNSFSDCALHFLCDYRLWVGFRTIEKIGAFADVHTGLLQMVSHGEYTPNPDSADFSLEGTIQAITEEKEACEKLRSLAGFEKAFESVVSDFDETRYPSEDDVAPDLPSRAVNGHGGRRCGGLEGVVAFQRKTRQMA